MCGITGIVEAEGNLTREAAEAMTEALRHRGPDDSGLWSDGHCALGHRRLSIIDLSEAGRQPMSDESGEAWITYNGEIYNFQLLRKELESLGYRFRTRTDTEVIIKAYRQWGVECVKRLRGMFALAIWDSQRRRLFLARDRVGKKPLFYAQSGKRFLFASELQAIVTDSGVERRVDLTAIDEYLSWGYVPAPRTAFEGVFKLPPAHWLTLELKPSGPELRVERYWELEYGPKHKLGEREAGEALREKLTEAVRLRMMSDVPLGAFLSGGVDSSIVVGLMAELSSQPVKTFSIGFEEVAYNELDHARRVARRCGTDHSEFIVKPDALRVLPKLVRHYGEPYADSSAIPTFYVSEMTRSRVTVALNGDGGDESFAGYERYLANRVAEWMRLVPGGRWPALALSRVLPDSTDPKSRLRRAKRFLSVAAKPQASRYGRWVSFFSEESKRELYSPDLRSLINGHRPEDWVASLFDRSQGLDPVDRAMAVDVLSYLPYDLLVKVDITAMANSLEARSPFLDHEVMEFAARLPVDLKLRGKQSKYLLKRAFADLLPPENVNRRKMGFGVPVGHWFRGSLRPLLEDALLSEQLARRKYFDASVVRSMVTDHIDGRADHSFALWNLLMLELWHREFIDPIRQPPA
jgi:asparagine synthase (glutamine-hydrolysing)